MRVQYIADNFVSNYKFLKKEFAYGTSEKNIIHSFLGKMAWNFFRLKRAEMYVDFQL